MATEVSLCIIFTSSSSPVWADSYQITLFTKPAVILNAAADRERQMGRQKKNQRQKKKSVHHVAATGSYTCWTSFSALSSAAGMHY